ncbi:MAG TPA: Fe-S cluster assembly protein SufD [Ignavibacteriaceae bacterium]|jgi:Fe-S cluster assembly protein SufD|nr:MAG: FeS cluster assembly protein SufD [Ignavibacteria bacterium ADurb.Bin266]OQY74977.1 MAG: Fe-S cluster assembly protein SufD [Ignavibacteriales bacterium UTCHB2]HQF41665.1 Fe-S cluster assembly protein SufD [Ignavibacteriaceae bacterium]HQI39481.1 Fe-S cluster assembly protein SufD [Ignavibacteriaceae bacterium]
MKEIKDINQYYIKQFDEFEKSLNGEKTSEFHQLRKSAINNFEKISLPTLKDEEWRHTDISSLLNHSFSPDYKKEKVSQKVISKFLFDKLEHSLLVFVNGAYSPELSKLIDIPKGVIVESLAEAIKNNNPIVKKHLGSYAKNENFFFTTLSSAFIKDGAFIYVPDGKLVEDPIHIIFYTKANDKKVLTQPRNLFVAGKNSQVSIIEHYVSDKEDVYFTNAVTEIVTDENAIVDHTKLQEESSRAFHIARMEVDQERSSNFASHLISLGAEISRNDFNARFNDEGGECMLNGLFMINNEQLFDAHTMIDHAKPHCNSYEHYKGILQDKARGVFNGKVMVRPDAQKTNAFQENNTILLSDDAVMNTKPQLEIFADDVKCSHGATIGKLNDEAKFYLKSRGIGEESATAILIHAFASDVITTIKIPALRDYLEEIITKRFNE